MTEIQALLGVPSDRVLFLPECASGQDPRELAQQTFNCQELSAGGRRRDKALHSPLSGLYFHLGSSLSLILLMRSDKLVILGNAVAAKTGRETYSLAFPQIPPSCLAWRIRQVQVGKQWVKPEPLQETDSRLPTAMFSLSFLSLAIYLFSKYLLSS